MHARQQPIGNRAERCYAKGVKLSPCFRTELRQPSLNMKETDHQNC